MKQLFCGSRTVRHIKCDQCGLNMSFAYLYYWGDREDGNMLTKDKEQSLHFN